MTNSVDPKTRRKKRKLKRRLLGFLAFVLMLIYLPAIWNWLFSVNYEIGVIKTDTLEVKLPLKGVFIRNEYFLKAPNNGICIPSAQYGDRVAVNNEIAQFIQSDMRETINNNREMELDILKKVITKYDNTTGSEREMWEKAIEKQLSMLTDSVNTGNYNNSESIRINIDHVLEARARQILDNPENADSLKNERNELNSLKNSTNKSVTVLYAPISGIVSYAALSGDPMLAPEKRNEATVELIDNTLDQEEGIQKWITPNEIPVSTDQYYAKLVMNDQAWFVFYVSEDKALNSLFNQNTQEGLILKLDAELNTVDSRVPIEFESIKSVDGKILVVGRMTQMIEQTMDSHAATGNLIIQSISGMKVPIKSLANENTVDQTADIVIVRMDKAMYKRVKIIGRQDAYAIIENLDPSDVEQSVNVFDVYIVDPKNIQEGQVIDK